MTSFACTRWKRLSANGHGRQFRSWTTSGLVSDVTSRLTASAMRSRPEPRLSTVGSSGARAGSAVISADYTRHLDGACCGIGLAVPRPNVHVVRSLGGNHMADDPKQNEGIEDPISNDQEM